MSTFTLTSTNFSEFIEHVEKKAESIAAGFEDHLGVGLNRYSIAYSDDHLAALVPPANRVPLPAMPVIPAGAGITKGQMEHYTIAKEIWQAVHAGIAALKTDVLACLPPSTVQAIQARNGTNGPGVAGHTMGDLMNYLWGRYSVLSGPDVAKLIQAAHEIRANSVEEFLPTVAQLRTIYKKLNAAGQPVSSFTQVTNLINVVSNNQGLTEAAKHYAMSVPALVNRNFEAAVDHIHARAVEIPTSGDLRYAGNAASANDRRNDTGRGRGGRGDSNKGRERGGRGRGHPVAPAAVVKQYCFAHGYTHKWQIPHVGAGCNHMASDTSFTAEMKAATAPAVIDGWKGCEKGST